MKNKILKIALPSIVSNIAVPLLGLVDVGITGHLGSAAYIGAIAIGGMIFNMIYWLFGFIRMGTSGMTSQFLGNRDLKAAMDLLLRSLFIALCISILIIVFQSPIEKSAFIFFDADTKIRNLADSYFRILIWGAPAVLCIYSFNGWFIGMQNSRFPMFVTIFQNLINIICSLTFVFLFKMQIKGIASGTLIAQYSGLFISLLFWNAYYGRLKKKVAVKDVLKRKEIKRFLNINSDIFFRTFLIICVSVFFTHASSAEGESVLAANTVLMQFFYIFSYMMDGFAYAGEALTGKYKGARNWKGMKKTVGQLFGWAAAISLLFSLFYAFFGHSLLVLLTNDFSVVKISESYLPWVILIPLSGFAAFIWDGIFIGHTATQEMLFSLFISSAIFFIGYYLFRQKMGNHALWLTFILYLASRGIVQTLLWGRIKESE